MARFNEISVGRYNRFLQKLLSMKGDAVTPILSTELSPAFPFFNGAENRYLESWQRFGVFITNGPIAAQTSIIAVRNPAGSNVVAVLEKVLILNTNATAQEFTVLQGPSGGVDQNTLVSNTVGRFDARGQQKSSMIVSTNVGVAAAGVVPPIVCAVLLPANTGFYDVIGTDIQEFPLLPGDYFWVGTANVNQSMATSVWWRERFLEDSERT